MRAIAGAGGSVWPWILVIILILALGAGAYAILSSWGSADTEDWWWCPASWA